MLGEKNLKKEKKMHIMFYEPEAVIQQTGVRMVFLPSLRLLK